MTKITILYICISLNLLLYSCSSENETVATSGSKSDSVGVDSTTTEINPNPSEGPLQSFVENDNIRMIALPVVLKPELNLSSDLKLNSEIYSLLELDENYEYTLSGYVMNGNSNGKLYVFHGINKKDNSIDGFTVFIDKNNKINEMRTIYSLRNIAGTITKQTAEITGYAQLVQKLQVFENNNKKKEDIMYFNLNFDRGIFEKIN